ncbi:MAG TPA: hypothetical protein VIF43_01150 [Patescibacteria group bacterium]|jgi:Na+/H+-dicarboxylate symporter
MFSEEIVIPWIAFAVTLVITIGAVRESRRLGKIGKDLGWLLLIVVLAAFTLGYALVETL